MGRAVLEAVARADIFLSSVPWRHIGLSLLTAVIVVHVVKRVIIERGARLMPWGLIIVVAVIFWVMATA